MMRRFVGALAGVLFAALWFLLLAPVAVGGPASYIIVSGISMEPTLHAGDLAVLQKRWSYQAGDIIGFRVPGGTVIHRIIGGSQATGFVTQGDNKAGPDPWQPRPPDILGRMWLRIPGAGRLIVALRQPHSFAALCAAAALLVLDEPRPKKRRKRGRGVRLVHAIVPRSVAAIEALKALSATFAALALILAGMALYSFRMPVSATVNEESVRYSHTGSFSFAVHTLPSELYPDGTVGPVSPPASGITGTVETLPVFTRLARSLSLDYTYALQCPEECDVQGEIRSDLVIKAGETWVRTLALGAPAPFAGPHAVAHADVDFSRVISLTDAIERETGYNPGVYELSVVPTVRIWGNIGAHKIDDTYAPAFVIRFGASQISLDPELRRSEARGITEQVTKPQRLSLLSMSLPVASVRRFSLIGLVVSALLAGLLAAAPFLGAGRGEASKIQARYGAMLVSVARVHWDGVHRVEVASMEDLARLAKRDGNVICHQASGQGSHLYFVLDGQVVYEYTVSEPAEKE